MSRNCCRTQVHQAANAAWENFDRAERRRLGCVLCSLMRPLRGAPSASASKLSRAVVAAVPFATLPAMPLPPGYRYHAVCHAVTAHRPGVQKPANGVLLLMSRNCYRTQIPQAANAAWENFDRAERRRLGCVLCSLMRPLRGAPSASVSKLSRAVVAAWKRLPDVQNRRDIGSPPCRAA